MTKENKTYGFKEVKDICGDKVTYYRLIGCNSVFIHDDFEETIQVLDDELDASEDSMTYPVSRFFEEYGGYHFGTEDVTIEDVIKMEYKFLIDAERSDFCATEAVMKSLNKPVSFKDIAYSNFN